MTQETTAAAVEYEVNLCVKKAVGQPFREWLHNKHLRDMLNTQCFLSARFYQEEARDGDDDHVRFVAIYTCASHEILKRYFDEHAPGMRADGLTRFPDQFTATRRVLHHVSTQHP